MAKYKVRFHLSKGVNYMKWQVRDNEGNVQYFEPSEVSLKLKDCKLKNQISTARKIHNGAHKAVCAWVECESVEVIDTVDVDGLGQLSYNPQTTPNWVLRNERSTSNGKNIDGCSFDEVVRSNRNLFSK